MIARVKAILRRSAANEEETQKNIKINDLELDSTKKKILIKNKTRKNVKDLLNKTPLQLAEQRCDEDLHKKIRKDLPGAYPNADYNKTIDILKK